MYFQLACSDPSFFLYIEKAGQMESGKVVLVTAAAGGTGQFAVQVLHKSRAIFSTICICAYVFRNYLFQQIESLLILCSCSRPKLDKQINVLQKLLRILYLSVCVSHSFYIGIHLSRIHYFILSFFQAFAYVAW